MSKCRYLDISKSRNPEIPAQSCRLSVVHRCVTAGDDGKGFAGSREGGNGLANMRERMADIGGTFAVGPREGGGCEVVLSFKLNGKP